MRLWTSKRDPWPWHRPAGNCSQCRFKPLVNSYIQQEVQTKWNVSFRDRVLYLLKPTLGPHKKFQHLARAMEVVITRCRIGHTKAKKSHIFSWWPSTTSQHCGQNLTIEQMRLECAVLQQSRDEYYTADSLETLFETTLGACIVKFLRGAGFVCVIWIQNNSLFESVTNWHYSEPEFTSTAPWDFVIALRSISSYDRTLPVKDG